MNRRPLVACVLIVLVGVTWLAGLTRLPAGELEQGWTNPPRQARLRAYWWWLNGNVTKAAITRDLEEMKAKGFGGALICDADGSEPGRQRPRARTGRPSSRPSGASSTSTPCAKPTGWAWR